MAQEGEPHRESESYLAKETLELIEREERENGGRKEFSDDQLLKEVAKGCALRL